MTYAIKTTFATTAAVAPARVLLPTMAIQVSFQEKIEGREGGILSSTFENGVQSDVVGPQRSYHHCKSE